MQALQWWPVWGVGLVLVTFAALIWSRQQRFEVIRELESAGGVVNTRSELPQSLAQRLPEIGFLNEPYAVSRMTKSGLDQLEQTCPDLTIMR